MNFARIVRLFVAWQLLIVIITAASFSWLPLRATFIGGSDQAWQTPSHISGILCYTHGQILTVSTMWTSPVKVMVMPNRRFSPYTPNL